MDLPTIIFLLLSVLGLTLLVAGVFVLLGLGASLLAGGLAALAVAAFIRRGMIMARGVTSG